MIIYIDSINQLVFEMEAECLLYMVGTESLNTASLGSIDRQGQLAFQHLGFEKSSLCKIWARIKLIYLSLSNSSVDHRSFLMLIAHSELHSRVFLTNIKLVGPDISMWFGVISLKNCAVDRYFPFFVCVCSGVSLPT